MNASSFPSKAIIFLIPLPFRDSIIFLASDSEEFMRYPSQVSFKEMSAFLEIFFRKIEFWA